MWTAWVVRHLNSMPHGFWIQQVTTGHSLPSTRIIQKSCDKNRSKHFLPVFQTFGEIEIADYKVNSWDKMCWQLVPRGGEGGRPDLF